VSEPITPAWLDQLEARAALVPIVVLHLPMGDRIYGVYWPGLAWAFDAPVLERGARITSMSPIEQGAEPIGQAVLGAWTQLELPHVSVELDNTDLAMGRLVGQEYLLKRAAEVYVTFPDLSPDDALLAVSGQIQQWTLTKKALRLEIARL